jgi:hypothetical protein
MSGQNFSPHQQKIIKRYYENYDSIKIQRLSDLAAELYLAETPKKKEKYWKQVDEILVALEFPTSRIAHLQAQRDPRLIVGIISEIEQSRGA